MRNRPTRVCARSGMILIAASGRAFAARRGTMPSAPTTPTSSGLEQLIRAEYDDMPGHCLSRAQIQRLWVLEPAVCDGALRSLVDAGYLRQARNGYVRGAS